MLAWYSPFRILLGSPDHPELESFAEEPGIGLSPVKIICADLCGSYGVSGRGGLMPQCIRLGPGAARISALGYFASRGPSFNSAVRSAWRSDRASKQVAL